MVSDDEYLPPAVPVSTSAHVYVTLPSKNFV